MGQDSDYYATLQVDPRAEREVIDAAYRKLASKYHPDVNRSRDATARMQQINAAYSVLSDPARRAEYDRSRVRPQNRARPADPPMEDRARDTARQAWYYFRWFLFLFLLGEAFQRLGGRGVVVVLVLTGLVWLLFRSKRLF